MFGSTQQTSSWNPRGGGGWLYSTLQWTDINTL